jgi:hypothetical protein
LNEVELTTTALKALVVSIRVCNGTLNARLQEAFQKSIDINYFNKTLGFECFAAIF